MNELEEVIRNLRILSLIYWDRGEIEASETVLNRARRLEDEINDHR
jgi:hypothetical protein